MSSSPPLVSVIIPTRNSAATVGACLSSVRGQAHEPIEIIVVDNFSSDDTVRIARGTAGVRVILHGPERCAQRNAGVRMARGEYVMLVDSDMELTPEVVGSCVRAMRDDSGRSGVVIPEESFGEGFWAECKRLERRFYEGVEWMEAARFFRRDTFVSVGGADESLVSGEDWDLSQRIAKCGTIVRIRERIRHNEGAPTLGTIVRKKWYYAGKIVAYADRNRGNGNVRRQMGLRSRYMLFLSRPRDVFRRPLLGMGMLFMKTCEFGAGGAAMLMIRTRAYFSRELHGSKPTYFGRYAPMPLRNNPIIPSSAWTHPDSKSVGLARKFPTEIGSLRLQTNMIEISVIIPTFNCAKTLLRTLRSLERVNFDPERFEVLVIDDGSTDGTSEMLDGVQEKTTLNMRRFRRERSAGFGAGQARDVGISEAVGGILAFTDADCTVAPGWLGAIRHAARDQGAALMCGEIRGDDLLMFPWRVAPVGHVGVTANLAYDAGRVGKIRFGDSWPNCRGEDVNLVARINDMGFDLRIVPGMTVTHPVTVLTCLGVIGRVLSRDNEVLLHKRYGRRLDHVTHPFFRPTLFGRVSPASAVTIAAVAGAAALLLDDFLLGLLVVGSTLLIFVAAFVAFLYRSCATGGDGGGVPVACRMRSALILPAYLVLFVCSRIRGTFRFRHFML